MTRSEDLWGTTAGRSNSFRTTLGLQSVQEFMTKTDDQLIHFIGKPVKAVLAPYSDPNPYGGSPTGAYDKKGRPKNSENPSQRFVFSHICFLSIR